MDAGACLTSAQPPRLAIQLPKAALPLKRRHGGRRRSRQRQCRPDRCTAGFVVSPKGHPLMCKMWIHTIPSRDPRGQGFGARPRCAQMRTLSLPCRPQAPGGHAPHHDTFVGACQLPGLGHPGLNHLAEGRQPPAPPPPPAALTCPATARRSCTPAIQHTEGASKCCRAPFREEITPNSLSVPTCSCQLLGPHRRPCLPSFAACAATSSTFKT